MVVDWVQPEFASLNLGHKQQNDRVIKFVSHASSFDESRPDRVRSNAEVKAIYRLTDNRKPNVDQGGGFAGGGATCWRGPDPRGAFDYCRSVRQKRLMRFQRTIAFVGYWNCISKHSRVGNHPERSTLALTSR